MHRGPKLTHLELSGGTVHQHGRCLRPRGELRDLRMRRRCQPRSGKVLAWREPHFRRREHARRGRDGHQEGGNTTACVWRGLRRSLRALCGELFARRHLSFPRTWLYAALGFATHGLLDACTTYGTQLLWPFSDARIAWNVISIIDPLFTVPILLLVVFAAARRWRRIFRCRAIGWHRYAKLRSASLHYALLRSASL